MKLSSPVVAILVVVGLIATSQSAPREKPVEGNPGVAPNTFQVHTFKGTNDHEIAYSLFSPTSLKDGEKLPLVLCLHGRGGNTEAAKASASPEMQQKHPCFVMAPACNGQDTWWVTFEFPRAPVRRGAESELMEALDAVVAAHPIDVDRIYITGQSMGGFGTWGLIALHPDKFAAAVPICGGWNPADAEKMKAVPIWAFHGAKDPTVPVKYTQDMIAALKKAGGEPKYTEFPDVSHGSWGKAYATPEMWDWMFEQRRGDAK